MLHGFFSLHEHLCHRHGHTLPLRPLQAEDRKRLPGGIPRRVAGQRLPLGNAQPRRQCRSALRRRRRQALGERPHGLRAQGLHCRQGHALQRQHHRLRRKERQQTQALERFACKRHPGHGSLQPRRLRQGPKAERRHRGHQLHTLPRRFHGRRQKAAPHAGVLLRGGRHSLHNQKLQEDLRHGRLEGDARARKHTHQRHPPHPVHSGADARADG